MNQDGKSIATMSLGQLFSMDCATQKYHLLMIGGRLGKTKKTVFPPEPSDVGLSRSQRFFSALIPFQLKTRGEYPPESLIIDSDDYSPEVSASFVSCLTDFRKSTPKLYKF